MIPLLVKIVLTPLALLDFWLSLMLSFLTWDGRYFDREDAMSILWKNNKSKKQ